MIKKILLVFVLLALMAGIYGYYQFNRTNKSLDSKKADMTIGVTDFLNEYQKDETAANAKYLDKVVEVKGKVAEVKKDENGAVKLSFDSGNPLSTVIFEMEKNAEEKALSLKPGAEITVKGVCTGSVGDIICVRSVVK